MALMMLFCAVLAACFAVMARGGQVVDGRRFGVEATEFWAFACKFWAGVSALSGGWGVALLAL